MSYTLRYQSTAAPTQTWSASAKIAVAALGVLIVFAVLALPSLPGHADPLLTYPLRVGEHVIRAEVANTPETRRKGLMFRTRLAAQSGMIFIFPKERRISMWMKNTRIPLSVAFIDSSGRIVNIERMQPNSEKTHSSTGPAKYALEMNQGWFSENGVKSGHLVTGLGQLPPPR